MKHEWVEMKFKKDGYYLRAGMTEAARVDSRNFEGMTCKALLDDDLHSINIGIGSKRKFLCVHQSVVIRRYNYLKGISSRKIGKDI